MRVLQGCPPPVFIVWLPHKWYLQAHGQMPIAFFTALLKCLQTPASSAGIWDGAESGIVWQQIVKWQKREEKQKAYGGKG